MGRTASPKSGHPGTRALRSPPQVVRPVGGRQGHLESWAESVGGSTLGPGAATLIVSSACVSHRAPPPTIFA